MESHHLLNLAIDQSAGPGWIMRAVILGSVVGVVLIAWFVLRGYSNND